MVTSLTLMSKIRIIKIPVGKMTVF